MSQISDYGVNPALLELLQRSHKTAYVAPDDPGLGVDPSAATAGPAIGMPGMAGLAGIPGLMGGGAAGGMGGQGQMPAGMGGGDMVNAVMGQAQAAAQAKPPKVDQNMFMLVVLTLLVQLAEKQGIHLSPSQFLPAMGAPVLPEAGAAPGAPAADEAPKVGSTRVSQGVGYPDPRPQREISPFDRMAASIAVMRARQA